MKWTRIRASVLAAVFVLGVGTIGAAPAQAASISIDCKNDSQTTRIGVGETLTISAAHCTIQSTIGVGTFSPFSGYIVNSLTFTSSQTGVAVLTVYGAGSSPTVLTIAVGGSGPAVTDPALVYPTASINANGGNCQGPTQHIKYQGQNASSGTFTAPTADTCTRTNYSLAGWARSATATTSEFAPGSTVPIGNEGFTLFAVWRPNGIEIVYDANVGLETQCLSSNGTNLTTAAERQTTPTVVPALSAADAQAPCTPVDAQLVGWALTGDGQSVVAPGAALPANFSQGSSQVLYAKWRVLYGLTSSTEAVVAGSGESVAVTFTATVNGSPAPGRSVEVLGNGASVAENSGGTPTSRMTALTSAAGQVTVFVRPTGTSQGTVSASFGNASFTLDVALPSVEKSITITGERTTVSGKPGIIVNGTTTGFKKGETVVPYIRFPGETTFTPGSARPEIGADGSFSWSRKTGKRVTVYFATEGGSVKSNKVTIATN